MRTMYDSMYENPQLTLRTMGEKVGEKLGEKRGEKRGEKLGEKLGWIFFHAHPCI